MPTVPSSSEQVCSDWRTLICGTEDSGDDFIIIKCTFI